MQTAVTFQESSVREFLLACNAGYLGDVVQYMHPTIHFQSYRGGLPDTMFEGLDHVRVYLETRMVTDRPRYTILELQCSNNQVRITYECSIAHNAEYTQVYFGTLIYFFWQNKIIQILDTA